MKVYVDHGYTELHLTPEETTEWARPWPVSAIAGRQVRALFDSRGDLTELDISPPGKPGEIDDEFDAPVQEFDALIESALGTAHPAAGRVYDRPAPWMPERSVSSHGIHPGE